MRATKRDIDFWGMLIFGGLLLAGVAAIIFFVGFILIILGIPLGALLSGLMTFLFFLAIIIILYAIAKATLSHIGDTIGHDTEILRSTSNGRIGSKVVINLPGNPWHRKKGILKSINGDMVEVQFGETSKEVYPQHLEWVDDNGRK